MNTFTALDADQIFEALEEKNTRTTDPYRQQIQELMAAELDRAGHPDTCHDAALLWETSAGFVLAEAARKTGFLMGFECFRNLVLKGGAR